METVHFRSSWRGYDRGEVDQFVRESVAIRQRLQGDIAMLDPSGSSRHQDRADEVVAMAHRHADEIRAAAEQEAHRLVKDAEQQALLLQREQLAAHQHERECITALRDSIESCLGTVASALERAREITTIPVLIEPTEAVSGSSNVVAKPEQTPVQASNEHSDGRRHALHWIAVAIWCVLMLSILVIVSMKPTTPAATVSPSVVSEPQPSIPPPSQPQQDQTLSSIAVPTVAPVEAASLTVTFVANQDCWVSIATDEGAANERFLMQDERVVIEADDVVTFKAGNAAALSILINDQPAAPLGVEGQVVAYRITRDNYRTFLPASEL